MLCTRHLRKGCSMSLSPRRLAALGIATTAAVGMLATSPAAQAAPTVPYRVVATNYVWTDANALAECQAEGQQMLAHYLWDGYQCRPDVVGPGAYRLYRVIITG